MSTPYFEWCSNVHNSCDAFCFGSKKVLLEFIGGTEWLNNNYNFFCIMSCWCIINVIFPVKAVVNHSQSLWIGIYLFNTFLFKNHDKLLTWRKILSNKNHSSRMLLFFINVEKRTSSQDYTFCARGGEGGNTTPVTPLGSNWVSSSIFKRLFRS